MTEVGQEGLDALEEQRRINEETAAAAEAKAIRGQRIKFITEIDRLERERDKVTNRLRRLSRQTLIRTNFQDLEDAYIATTNLNSRLNSRINYWADLLDTNEDGDPIYPDQGVPRYRYSPEAKDFLRKTRIMEEVLTTTQEAMMIL